MGWLRWVWWSVFPMIFEIFGPIPECPSVFAHLERFSPGEICSEVGGPGGLFKAIGCPTLERISPGENLSKCPEITRELRNWPK